MRPLFEKYDLLLTPTLSVAAFPVGRLNPEHWSQHVWDWIRWASFSYPFNFTGQPAASVPAGFTPAGLPVGLQIVGRRFADLTVLQASAAFEAARPWAQRRPDSRLTPVTESRADELWTPRAGGAVRRSAVRVRPAGGTAAPPRRGPKARACGSTWTRPSSTPPTTRTSGRPIEISSSGATRPTARPSARGSARRSATPTAPTPVEGLDVYADQRAPNAPINVFIHGGAWRAGLARNYAFPAELFVRAGAHFVVPDFAAVQDVGGSLMPMADQVRRAVAWVQRNARSFGGDPDRIYVSGHSSGAPSGRRGPDHRLARDFDLPADTVKGGLCSSGMYDLKPVRLSARSNYVKFTDEMEQALSSQRHLDRLNAPRRRQPTARSSRRSSSARRATSPRP